MYWGDVSASGRLSAPISLERSCCHRASGRHRSKLCELPKVLSGGGKKEFISGAAGAAQSEAAKPEDSFEMSEQYLGLLAPVPRTFVGQSVREGSGYIASILIEIARHFALRRVRQHFALRTQRWQSDLLERYSRVPSLVMPERGGA
jgi:hypothetical protein